jgi:hypothetical protein
LVAWGSTSIPVAAGSYRLAPWNEDIVAIAAQFAWASGCPLVLACISVRHNVLGAADEDITYELFINGAGTGLTVTLAADAPFATSVLPNIPVSPSDDVELVATHDGLTSSPQRVVVTATTGSQVFGLDPQCVESLPLFCVGAGLPPPTPFVTKPGAVLVTPALTGTYRLAWHAIVSTTNPNTQVGVRLRNTTDAVDVGVVQRFEAETSGGANPDKEDMNAVHKIVLAGAPKTFELQISKQAVPINASVCIEQAVIELWRVG